MNRDDIRTLQRLLELKRQVDESAFKKRAEAQKALMHEAERMQHEAFRTSTPGTEQPTNVEFLALERFREKMLQEASRLRKSAQEMSAELDAARSTTQHALRREQALQTISTQVQRAVRAEANNRDEDLREQNTLLNY